MRHLAGIAVSLQKPEGINNAQSEPTTSPCTIGIAAETARSAAQIGIQCERRNVPKRNVRPGFAALDDRYHVDRAEN